jgi:peptide chain release factor subunit 1
MTEQNDDVAVEQWKMKKLIKSLEAARGNGTSVISLIIPPKTQLSQVSQMLVTEEGTASNIKSRVNRASVLSAIGSARQRLKLFTKIPDNGLVLYCGEVLTDDGKEKKVTIDLEPFKPISAFLYMCDNRFHVEPLKALLQDDERFGFIVMDGNGALFGMVTGSQRVVLQQFAVDLPKKHGRGGQSAPRFARIREEKRHHYVKKVCETAVANFVTNDRPNVSGLILAGSADFKNNLKSFDLLDPRLLNIIIGTFDIAYGGENGFTQAIAMAGETLTGVKLVREQKLLQTFYTELAKDSGKYCYSVNDVLAALEMGAVDQLIVWEALPHNRYEIRDKDTGETTVKVFSPEQEERGEHLLDNTEIISKESLLEWISNNYKSFNATLSFVSDKTPESAQLVMGFGGMCAFLRYPLDLSSVELEDIDDDGFI